MKHPRSYRSTPEIRRRMSKVHLKHGKAETMLAKALWHRGYRYRLNYKKLPGSPDIALTKQKIAIFVDGEFWHGYDWIHKQDKIRSNPDYWREKIEENIARDMRDGQRLAAMEWTVLRFWEKDVKRDLAKCLQTIETAIFDGRIQQSDLLCEDLSDDTADTR